MPAPAQHRIIFDTDPGVDDAMALLLALRSPEIEVIGLTTVFGNSTVDVTTRNALNLLALAGRKDIPVARGAGCPLVMPLGGTGEWVHGDDAMGNVGWHAQLDPAQRPVDQHAAEFIVEQVMAHPGEITLVPVAPLTNLALALRLEPRVARNVREVVMMGGAALSPGNVSPLAEANIYGDPHAADIVFAAEWPIVMAGLDLTESMHADNRIWHLLRDSGDPFGVFLAGAVGFYQSFHATWYGLDNGATYMHDPCTIAYLIDPTLFEGEDWAITVPVEGPAKGATIVDRRGKFYKTPKVHCLLKGDEAGLLRLFQQRLAKIPPQ